MVSSSMDAQIAADDVEIEKMREKFGDAEAAKLAADLYKIRRTPPAPAGYTFGQFPRAIVILIALWVGLLETADKLPKLLLTIPQYEATLAEYNAKLMQPDLTKAQLDKAKFDARAAAFQPDLSSVQLDKMKLETKAAAFAPDTASIMLDKTRADAKAAKWQPYLMYTQAQQARAQWMSGGPNDAWSSEYVRHIIKLEPYE